MIKKKTISFLIKALVSISILIVILINIDWSTAVKNLGNANLLLLILVLSLNIVERLEITYKWNLLLKVRGLIVSFGRLFLINSIGSFLGLFLPSSLGTDVIRGYYLVRNNSEKSISISSVFVDCIFGMFSLLLLCLVSILFIGDILPNLHISLYVILLTIIIAITFYFFQKKETAIFLEKIFQKIKYKKLIENGIKLHTSILEYKRYPRTLIVSFLITLIVQLTRILIFYYTALAFNVSVPFVYFVLFIPIIMLVIMIPISIGGLGIREGTFVAFFTLMGMSLNDAVLISFTTTFIDTLNTLFFGGGGYLLYRVPVKDEIILEKSEKLNQIKI